jgi:flagellar motor switch protein FliN
MSQELELPPFERPPAEPADELLAGTPGDDLGRLRDVPVELAVEIGRTRMTVGATLELRPGSVVVLDRMAGEPVDLLVNGTPIARGEVVVIDEEFALRVTQVLGEHAHADGAPPPEGTPAAGADDPADALKPAPAGPITGEPATP